MALPLAGSGRDGTAWRDPLPVPGSSALTSADFLIAPGDDLGEHVTLVLVHHQLGLDRQRRRMPGGV